MKRACLAVNTTELASSTELTKYEQNHASSIRPLKVNFVRMKLHYLILFSVFGLFACTQNNKPNSVTAYVDPFIGTDAHGHTFPGATTPFGMVQLSPDNEKRGWDWCSGYHSSDSIIIGFTHTHLSGTGCGDLMDVLFMPVTQAPVADTTGKGNQFIYQFKSAFSHSSEVARPGYYAVTLDKSAVRVELTASPRAGFHRYTFPKGQTPRIVIDLSPKGGWDRSLGTSIKLVNDSTVIGYVFTTGWTPNQKVFFAARFSKPVVNYQTSTTGELLTNVDSVNGISCKAILEFAAEDKTEILAKVGISSVDVQGALNNLDTEIAHWNFDQTASEADARWTAVLSNYQVETNNDDARRIFYTALYHSYIHPSLYSDVDGRYRTHNDSIKKTDGYDHFFTFSLWDTFRAMHPLFTLTEGKQVNQFIKSMLTHYRDFGLLPVWSLWGGETYCMIGYHAIPVIVDAYLKGLTKDIDPEELYSALKTSAMGQDKSKNHQDLDLYLQYGYMPYDTEAMRCENIYKCPNYNQSASRTLEWAYDDWCIAQMAKSLNKTADYNYFMKRSQAYKHLSDSTTGFMHPRNADGSWLSPFNPSYTKFDNGFTEGNSWQYSWFVPQNVSHLIGLMGGKQGFTNRLDSLFAQSSQLNEGAHVDVSGLIGQYAHGNEPSHHVVYLYSYAGAPWKTQEKVALVRDSLYTANRDGLCGNDDCGQMSAWYVFNAMGFYPVNPASGQYVIGTPLFDKLTVKVSEGKTFTTIAKNLSKKNIYIQKAWLNKKPLDRSYILHTEITAGGTLEFEMGPKPVKDLWSGLSACPISQ